MIIKITLGNHDQQHEIQVARIPYQNTHISVVISSSESRVRYSRTVHIVCPPRSERYSERGSQSTGATITNNTRTGYNELKSKPLDRSKDQLVGRTAGSARAMEDLYHQRCCWRSIFTTTSLSCSTELVRLSSPSSTLFLDLMKPTNE